ncbi:MAG: septation protein IspZ [Thiohalomonadaceae bacterium]|jgi:uncharacterized membrane protein
MAQRASWLLLLAYPAAVHYGVLTASYTPAIILLAVITGLLAGKGSSGFRPCYALLAAALVIFVAFILADNYSLFLWPPLLIYFAMASLFAVSLFPGRTPLVTRIAALLDGELDAATQRYTRTVTAAWAVFLATLGIISLSLAYCGTRQAWSLFTNLIGYLLILGFFIIEFFMRYRCLPHLPQRSFFNFLQTMARLKLTSWRK